MIAIPASFTYDTRGGEAEPCAHCNRRKKAGVIVHASFPPDNGAMALAFCMTCWRKMERAASGRRGVIWLYTFGARMRTDEQY
jgi:hypothetical protein